MPEMRFRVRWPDDSEELCYSPSLIIKDYFAEGQIVPLDDFLAKSREALEIASERVRAKYGFACSAAMDQLARIETTGKAFADTPDARVTICTFEE